MKYLLVQNQKSKRILAVIAAEVEAELDRELGQLLLRQPKLVENIAEAETVKFDSTDSLAEHLLREDKPKKGAYAQDEKSTSDSQSTADEEVDELQRIFTFGKHKYKTIEQILKEDPSYLNWAKDNVSWFDSSDELIGIINACIKGKNCNTQITYTPPSFPPIPNRTNDFDDNGDDLPF